MNDDKKDNSCRKQFRFLTFEHDNAICTTNPKPSSRLLLKQGKKWDEEVTAEFHIDLQKWIYEFNSMPDFTTRKCLVTGTTTSQHLLVFTDAPNIATSAVIYMRSTATEGNVIVNYVIGKSRVAPIKQTNILQLELEAAIMGTEQATVVVTEMTLNFSSFHFWTDSTAKLGWINSDKRHKFIVTKRVNKIFEHSKADECKYIPGKINLADHGTRGLKTSELEEKWLKGPENKVFNNDKFKITEVYEICHKTKKIFNLETIAQQDNNRAQINKHFAKKRQ